MLMDAARNIMNTAGSCALITLDQEGRPRVRAMDAFPPEKDFTVWFGTNKNTRKVEQIRNDPRVTLYYLEDNEAGYVMIHGNAELVDDPEQKEKRWKEGWEAFYQNKDEDYLLIRVTPKWMEVVSYTYGIEGDPLTWEPPIVLFGDEKDSVGEPGSKTMHCDPNGPIDTTKFSMIYFVFDPGLSNDYSFPLYFNGQFIYKFQHKARLQYKIFSVGELVVERRGKSYGTEPQITFNVQSGREYGIRVIINDPDALDVYRRYSIHLVEDPTKIKWFIENVFYGFKAFKTSDLKYQEDLDTPLIQRTTNVSNN
jgi:general stress protein 26